MTNQTIQTATSQRRQAIITLCLLGITWGSGFSIARFAVTHGVTPLGYAFWQALGPAIVLSFFPQRQPKNPVKQSSWLHWKFYAICGLTGIAIPNANMYFSAQHLPAGLLGVLINTAPIFTLLISWIILSKRPHLLQTLGILLCAFGLVWLTIPHVNWHIGNLHTGNWSTGWVLSTLISPFSYACCALYTQYARPAGIPPLRLAGGMMWAATLWITPLVIYKQAFYPLWSPPYGFQDTAILLEIALSSLGYVLFFRLITCAGALYYSLVSGVVACTGLFWGAWLFNERFGSRAIIAIVAIILGILSSTWQLSDKKNNQ